MNDESSSPPQLEKVESSDTVGSRPPRAVRDTIIVSPPPRPLGAPVNVKDKDDKHSIHGNFEELLDGEDILMEEGTSLLPYNKSKSSTTSTNAAAQSPISVPRQPSRSSSIDSFSFDKTSTPKSLLSTRNLNQAAGIIHPFESQAEALIIKALDRRQEYADTNHPNNNVSLLQLGHIPTTRSDSRRPRRLSTEAQLAHLSDTLMDLHHNAGGAVELFMNRQRTNTSSSHPAPIEDDFNDQYSNDEDDDGDSKKSNGSAYKAEWVKLQHNKGGSVRKGLGGIQEVVAAEERTDSPDCTADVELGGVQECSKTKKKKKHHNYRFIHKAQPQVVSDLQAFVGQRRSGLLTYVRFLCLVIVPSVVIAVILYYWGGNPPNGTWHWKNGKLVSENGDSSDPGDTSISWWFLFVGVRQALIFSLAQLIQMVLIDFLCLDTRCFAQVFGNLVTLLMVQSKGWPFLCCCWGSLSFAFLHGDSRFSKHWLYAQDWIGIFSERNPGGSATESIWYTRTLLIAISLSVLVAVKRLVVGLFLGKKTYCDNADPLTRTVKKVIMLSEVAGLARQCHVESMSSDASEIAKPRPITARLSTEQLRGWLASDAPDDNDNPDNRRQDMADRAIINSNEKIKVRDLLGDWEDPELARENQNMTVTISSILQFRHSLSLLNTPFIFSIAWGDVSSREAMVLSSEEVYRRLMYRSPDSSILSFDVLVSICRNRAGLDQAKLKDLIRLLRPDRNGNLTLLDFVKSVDSVYKEVKLLRVNIKNSEKIDMALERAINVAFYIVTGSVLLSHLGFSPFTLFLSLSSIILAFAFMIGSAASKICEGWLFILIRRPYGIGDRIHVAGTESGSSLDGSAGWIVQDVTLFQTIVLYGSTNEQAAIANSSLASSRIINMAMSPNPVIHFNLHFSIDTPHDKIKLFESTVQEFVKERPREWMAFKAFRVHLISVERGFVEYKMLLLHRESWQQIGVVLQSKADVSSFCLELTKKLGMRYRCPPLPVRLSMSTSAQIEAVNAGLKYAFSDTSNDALSDFTVSKRVSMVM